VHLFLICVFDTWALLLGLYGRYFYIVWVRAVENYRDAEAAHAEAVHALKDAKIAMLLRRLRARAVQ
jgi:hypothetical protein